MGGPRVVGRGGVELHLRATSVVEPGVAALAGPVGEAPLPSGGVTLVAIAELPGRPGHAVGAAWGRADATGAVLDMTVVDPAHRGQGIGRQVVGEWCRAAVDRGAGVVAARPLDLPGTAEGVAGGGPEAFLSALGFGAVDATTWCRRVGPLGELGSLP